jgi:hypothetical protein
MELLVKAVAHLEILAREARTRGDEESYEILITAQNTVLHAVLVTARFKELHSINADTAEPQRPKLSVVR